MWACLTGANYRGGIMKKIIRRKKRVLSQKAEDILAGLLFGPLVYALLVLVMSLDVFFEG